MLQDKPIFLVDAMLGKLAKKMRLLGYDTFYSSNIEDNELIRIAKKENRIIITKDVQLAKKSIKQEIDTIPLTKSNEIEQFVEINEKLKLGKFIIDGSNTRCPVCNGELETIEKKLVKDKVPEGVFDNTQEFWKCNNCKKIYWEGTHIRNLQEFTTRLNDRL